MAPRSNHPKEQQCQSFSKRNNKQKTQTNLRDPPEGSLGGSRSTQNSSDSSSAGIAFPNRLQRRRGSKFDKQYDDEFGSSMPLDPNTRMRKMVEENTGRIDTIEKQLDDLSKIVADRKRKSSKTTKKTGNRSSPKSDEGTKGNQAWCSFNWVNRFSAISPISYAYGAMMRENNGLDVAPHCVLFPLVPKFFHNYELSCLCFLPVRNLRSMSLITTTWIILSYHGDLYNEVKADFASTLMIFQSEFSRQEPMRTIK